MTRKVVVLLYSLWVLVAWFACARAASVADEAIKERTIVFYGSVPEDQITKLNDAFQKKHPFLTVQYVRAGPSALLNRVFTEARARSHFVDVISLDTFSAWLVKEAGLLQPFKSKETDAFPAQYRDADGLIPCCMYVLTNVIGYNTRLISKNEAPTSYQDLLDPKWKGKMGLNTDDSKWFAPLVRIWGKEKTVNYFQALMRQEPLLRENPALQGQLLAAGDVNVVVNLFGYYVLDLQARGAPVDIVQADPTILRPGHLLLAKQAPHPNAAKLFMDYAHSADGQQVLADLGREVARPGIKMKYPRLLQAVNLYPVKPEMAKDYDQLNKLYLSVLKQ